MSGGHVLDEDGDSMPGVMVRVMRYQYLQGERRLTPAGTGPVRQRRGPSTGPVKFEEPDWALLEGASLRPLRATHLASTPVLSWVHLNHPATKEISQAARDLFVRN